jgi:hypothetical protein
LSSKLIDPDVISANEAGVLTAEQHAVIKSILPGLGNVFSNLFFFCATGLLTAFLVYTLIISPALRNWRSPAKALTSVTEISFYFFIIVGIFALITVLVAFSCLKSLRTYLSARSVLKPGAVRRAEGLIHRLGAKYAAYFPEDKIPLKVWNKAEIDVVIPGKHQIFYLPLKDENWLMSIKPYPADAEALRNLFAVLVNANGFDAQALESNRRGLLSQNQISGSKIALSPELAAGRVETAEGAAQKVLAPRLPSKEKFVAAAFDIAADVAFDIAANVALAAVFGSGGSSSSSDNSSSGDDDEDNGREENMFVQCAYEIQGIRFPVSRESYDALIEGVRYRAYYLPQSKTLVNIEPVSYN